MTSAAEGPAAAEWTARGASPHGAGAATAGAGLSQEWREHALEQQRSAMPRSGRVLLSCPAALDSGGLGRHARELMDALAGAQLQASYLCAAGGATAGAREVGSGGLSRMLAPLTRYSRAWRMWAVSADFDRRAAAALPPAEHLIAFNGTALAQLRRARELAHCSLSLVSANSHYRHVLAQHARAHARYPFERPWVTHLLRRNLAEYGLAERILYASDYIRDSFLAAGAREESLVRFPLTPHPRYQPSVRAGARGTFDIAYVGSLTVHKGVPLLVDALRRLPQEDIRLVLVGGWGTRAMRRYIERARAADRRIELAPGDPLAVLARAGVCAHAAWEDGFGYAPAEALACGVPVIVSEDTGMKELIERGRSGVVLPTGELDALVQALEAAYEGRLLAR